MEKTDLKIKLKLGQRLGYDGKSAYQIWLEQGNSGTEDEFLASLKGKQGEKGNDGAPGTPGEKGEKGNDGKSAYRQWLDAGNTGTEDDFLASLKGEQGEKGEKGDDGAPGTPGEKGEKGDDGADGKSAYRQWLDAGNTGTEDDFLVSLAHDRKESASVFIYSENSFPFAITFTDAETSTEFKTVTIAKDATDRANVTVYLPVDKTYVISVPDVDGFTKPNDVIVTTSKGTYHNIQLNYQGATLTVSADGNTAVSMKVENTTSGEILYKGNARYKSFIFKTGDGYRVTAALAYNGYGSIPFEDSGVMTAGKFISVSDSTMQSFNVQNQTSYTAQVKVEDTTEGVTIHESSVAKNSHIQCGFMKRTSAYRVTARLDDENSTVLFVFGMMSNGNTIMLRNETCVVTLFNTSGYTAMVKALDTTSGKTLYEGMLAANDQEQVQIVYGHELKVMAVINDGDASTYEKIQSVTGVNNVYIQHQGYILQLNASNGQYERTYIVIDADTGAVIATRTVLYGEFRRVIIPLGTKFSVSLQSPTTAGFTFAHDAVVTGMATVPAGQDNVTRSVNLTYTDAKALVLSGHINHVDPQPDIPFTVKKKAGGAVLFAGTINSVNRNRYFPVPTGLILVCEWGDVPGYLTPSVQETEVASSANFSAAYGYSFFRIQNNNAFAISFVIANADTLETLHSGTVKSSFITGYLPVKPGTNYSITYGAISGHTAPAPDTGTAFNNGNVIKTPIYS